METFVAIRNDLRTLWNWLRGRKTPPLDLDNVLSNIEPEETPLLRLYGWHGWEEKLDENGNPYLEKKAERRIEPEKTPMRLYGRRGRMHVWEKKLDDDGNPYLEKKVERI